MAPSLQESLRDSGKSRADLWAFAAIVATEYGIETNNMVCDGTYNNNPGKQCSHEIGTTNCKINLARGFKFKTGRRDCTSTGDQPYKSTKKESHPNPVGNGQMLVDFFTKDFGFNGREIVAAMGAHTFGRLHSGVSQFR